MNKPLNAMLGKIKKLLFPGRDVRTVLLNKMPKNAVCVEVGSWKGDFARRILDVTKPKKLYLVDPYKYVPQYENACFGGAVGSQEEMDKIYNGVAMRFAPEISSGTLEIKRGPSTEGLGTFADNSLDWVYIDGNHTYEYVKKDLELSWRKVKNGGLVVGDDYNIPGWWADGVTRAVKEFVAMNNAAIERAEIIGSQFTIRKK